MGREIKRVPADFDWPIGQRWHGYLNQKSPAIKCTSCKGTGFGPHGHYLNVIAHKIALGGSCPEGHVSMPSGYSHAEAFTRGKGPGLKWIEFSGALAGRMPSASGGHDGIDRCRIGRALIKAAGLPEDWMTCETCKGHGVSNHDEVEAHNAAWSMTEPPIGDAYQVWETNTEGSPITPPFTDPKALARWCVEEAVPIFGASSTMSYDRWLTFITGPGSAPTRYPPQE